METQNSREAANERMQRMVDYEFRAMEALFKILPPLPPTDEELSRMDEDWDAERNYRDAGITEDAE